MRYHLVGIAGAGMSGIAHLLLDQGHTVTGSDQTQNAQTEALVARGVHIHLGHAAENIGDAEVLVSTSAVNKEHIELKTALKRRIPVIWRANLWFDWSQQRPVIAVAGTHGKTTTSAMIALALRAIGMPVGYLIGGEVPALGGNASWGDPQAPLIIEADEYGRTFLALRPSIIVITNVEWDHPDIYTSAKEYQETFAEFAAGVPPDRLILCGDDPGCLALNIPDARWYGIDERISLNPASCRLAPLDLSASALFRGNEGSHYELWRYDRRRFATSIAGRQALKLTGDHNIRNSLAALAVTDLLGGDLSAASQAIKKFTGAARRFEYKGEVNGVTVIDDYAHHPTEVAATLAAARQRFPQRRLLAYLQPHTFSRTALLTEQWAAALTNANRVFVGDIYASRETGDAQEAARNLVTHLQAHDLAVEAAGSVADASALIASQVQANDVVITLSAGDGTKVATNLLELIPKAS